MTPPPKFEVDPTTLKVAFLDYNAPTLQSLALKNVVFNVAEFHVTVHFQILFQVQDIIAVVDRLVETRLSQPLTLTYSTRQYGQPDILRIEWLGQIAEIPESDDFWDALQQLLTEIVQRNAELAAGQ